MYVLFDFRQLEDITTAAKNPMTVLNEDENTGNECPNLEEAIKTNAPQIVPNQGLQFLSNDSSQKRCPKQIYFTKVLKRGAQVSVRMIHPINVV